ncbi:luciferase-like protein [Leptotrombidium deliense]|uniref:Luciferase-like protein n=1 Tax=Leptotrombidium deliense TaxID=299467 RepID=A0A443SCL4_9ACAR|nr:luciferase-like protein [Leptotrombidium deliense]
MFQSLYDGCMKVGAALIKKLDLKDGDCLLVYGYNSWEFLCAVIAGLAAGALVRTMRAMDSDYEVIQELAQMKVSYIFITDEKRQLANIIKQEMEQKNLKDLKHIIIIDNAWEEKEFYALRMLIRDCDHQLTDSEVYDPKGNQETIAMILESSGTEGPVKGVLLGHYDLATVFAKSNIFDVKENDILSGHSFIGHLSGLATNFLSIIYGSKLVSFRVPNADSILEAITQYKITVGLFSPYYLDLMQTNMKGKRNINLNSLTQVFVSGSRLSKKTTEEFLWKQKECKVFGNVYLLTEATGILMLAINHPNVDSIGNVAAGVQAKVINAKGELLGANKIGELCVKPVIKFKGYHNDKESTDRILDKHGWLHTSDIGYFDNNENFYIIDHSHNVIRRGDEIFSPVEVEAVLLQHFAVKEVCCVGRRDGIHAFVIPDELFKENVTSSDIKTFVNNKVNNNRKIRGVHFVPKIPRTDFGKVLREKLCLIYNHILQEHKHRRSQTNLTQIPENK